ncbi:hypothetical protein FQZ97_822080 [compost metagenome]
MKRRKRRRCTVECPGSAVALAVLEQQFGRLSGAGDQAFCSWIRLLPKSPSVEAAAVGAGVPRVMWVPLTDSVGVRRHRIHPLSRYSGITHGQKID